MPNVAMLLSNPFRPDPRVLKEARSLTQAGYAVSVICWDRKREYPPNERTEGFEIRRVYRHSGYASGSRQIFYLPRFLLSAINELHIVRPSIVHCHDLDTTLVGYWYARTHHIPWIFDAHECYPEQIGPQVNRIIYRILLFVERQMTRRASHVLTVGELLAGRFRSMGGQVSVVGNYQDIDTFLPKNDITRADLGIRPDEFVIAYIGGFTLGRAILPLIKATEYLRDMKVLLVGSGPQCEAIESELPDHPKVLYVGQVPQEQVVDYTALADVIYYGLYSNHGNNHFSAPNALFNALAASKPVLTTNVGEIAHIVRNEECGVVVKKPTPDYLAQAIKQLQDQTFREALSTNSHRVAQAKYNWNISEKTLLNIYKQLTPEF